MTAMAPQFAYIMNRKLQPDSDVLRIHILYVMNTFSTCHERKPRLHDDTVTGDTDKTSTGWYEFLLAVVSHQMSD